MQFYGFFYHSSRWDKWEEKRRNFVLNTHMQVGKLDFGLMIKTDNLLEYGRFYEHILILCVCGYGR